MSDTTEHAPAPAEEYRPTHVLSSEDEPEQQPQPPPTERPREGDPLAEGGRPAEGDKPAEADITEQLKKLEQATRARIDSLTRQRTEERQAREAAERRLASLEERLRTGQTADPQSDMERLIEERASKLADERLAAREEQTRVSSFHDAGKAAYTDWQQRCTDLMEMGADPGFARILVDMGSDGARIAGDLVDNPGEVARIAALPTERARAVALGQYAAALTAKRATPPAAPPRSAMPPPIRPPSNARARPEPNPEGSMEDFLKWSKEHLNGG